MRTLIAFVLEKALQTKKLNSYPDFKLYCLNLAIRKKNRDSLNKSCFTSSGVFGRQKSTSTREQRKSAWNERKLL